MSSFMNIRPMGAELFHADRQMDMTKLILRTSINIGIYIVTVVIEMSLDRQ
jgi:hypothetical protein